MKPDTINNKMKRKLYEKQYLKRIGLEYKNRVEYRKIRILEEPAAKEINNPKIPSTYSESLLCWAIKEGFLDIQDHDIYSNVIDAGLGDKHKDIFVYLDNVTKRRLHVEAKATSDQGYISLGENDKIADYIVWLDFKGRDGDLITEFGKVCLGK